ncbi:MAG: VWA domain-containing protein [Lentisphaerae bacterium]|nr:VWA domain-containing protein [Lentisphaerota bacterium]
MRRLIVCGFWAMVLGIGGIESRGELRVARDTAIQTEAGVLKKVWVVKDGATLFRDLGKASILGTLDQNDKAYHFGEVGDGLIAVGDHPKRDECSSFFGFIDARDVIVWDTDQALRFVGDSPEIEVPVYADGELKTKVADVGVRPTSDPTVLPFPIFERTADGRAFKIAFVSSAAAGSDLSEVAKQTLAASITPKTVEGFSHLDVAFVMDVTGSMADELDAAKNHVWRLIDEFSKHKVEILGRTEPLSLRFAFVGYRDKEEDGDNWITAIPFSHRGMEEEFRTRLNSIEAGGGGDNPESVYSAIQEALALDWERAYAKTIILIGDAPPKDQHLQDAVLNACKERFIRIHGIVVGGHPETQKAFGGLSVATQGRCQLIADVEDSETVQTIVEYLRQGKEQSDAEDEALVEIAKSRASGRLLGAALSRKMQEFIYRGVYRDGADNPLPPSVFVSSRPDPNRQVCLYKSKARLHDMLAEMQGGFVGMIEGATPELLLALQGGAIEVLAELDTKTLASVVDFDPATAPPQLKKMLEDMPRLPEIVEELMRKGALADWYEMTKAIVELQRFVANPENFYEGYAWVPLDIMRGTGAK